MKRLVLCALATAALLAVPSLAEARRHQSHHATRHAAHHSRSGRSANQYTGYHGGDTSQGNAAVDNLNAQSLARARGTAQ